MALEGEVFRYHRRLIRLPDSPEGYCSPVPAAESRLSRRPDTRPCAPLVMEQNKNMWAGEGTKALNDMGFRERSDFAGIF
jgi:hypothetical protein